MKIIDTHAHLDQVKDTGQALVNAVNAGVTDILAPGIDLNSSQKNLSIKLETAEPSVHLAMGMHPSEADKESSDGLVSFIRDNIAEIKAIGEIGLDFWYKWVRKDEERKDRQRRVFRTFLELSRELRLPVVVHSRGAWRECLDTIRSYKVDKAVFHYYSGPVDIMKDILSCGYYVSTTPSVAYSPHSREAMKYAPVGQTMIETDSPVYFRYGQGENGFNAEPRDVFKTFKAYCELKDVDEKKALDILNKNAREFFSLD